MIERSSSTPRAAVRGSVARRGIVTAIAHDNVAGQMQGGGVVVFELEDSVAERGSCRVLVGHYVEVDSVVSALVGQDIVSKSHVRILHGAVGDGELDAADRVGQLDGKK